MQTTHFILTVKIGVGVTIGSQLLRFSFSCREQIRPLTELYSPCRAGLGTGGFKTIGYPVDAKPALPRRSINLIFVGNMEGASLNTITTAYTPLLVDNNGLPLVRYSSGGTHFLTTGFGTVHACMRPE
jgi:hypothetical protein